MHHLQTLNDDAVYIMALAISVCSMQTDVVSAMQLNHIALWDGRSVTQADSLSNALQCKKVIRGGSEQML